MAKVLVVYYSRTGNTQTMAELIAENLKKKGQEVILKNVEEATPEDMQAADGVIIGSPTYYGSMAAEVKKLLDDSVKLHGELDGKLAAAFSTAANIAGGNETTILDILNGLLIHGFIIQGDPMGSHYGPVAIGAPDARAKKECQRLADRFSVLLSKIAGK
ncbi:MAG: NAD(P)H-dependent oxidoreductase [Candidatus Omnitrophica bacterium]|nr:NAD(P)H-dependent oxidoreductase [Candidatus Omnitrophota bacterium]